MAGQLQPGNSTQLALVSYNFTMDEVKEIYSLYVDNCFSLEVSRTSDNPIRNVLMAVDNRLTCGYIKVIL